MNRWPSPLYVICDVALCQQAGWDPVVFAEACFDAGATVLQVRAKQLASGPLTDLADAVVRAAEPFGALVIVNDRPDVARVASAGGVHLGQDDVPPSAARLCLGTRVRVGLSTHTPEQIASAVADSALDHIAIGPVFATTTKPTGYNAVGCSGVRLAAQAAAARQLPVIAIGGISLDRAPQVLEAGASAVAVISDLMSSDPSERVRAYLDRLGARRRV